MSYTKSIAAGLAAALIGTAGLAGEMKIYPYNAENFCPTGLQPITISGVVCCGTPNTQQSYQSVMAHPVSTTVYKVRRDSSASCPEGVKGCY